MATPSPFVKQNPNQSTQPPVKSSKPAPVVFVEPNKNQSTQGPAPTVIQNSSSSRSGGSSRNRGGGASNNDTSSSNVVSTPTPSQTTKVIGGTPPQQPQYSLEKQQPGQSPFVNNNPNASYQQPISQSPFTNQDIYGKTKIIGKTESNVSREASKLQSGVPFVNMTPRFTTVTPQQASFLGFSGMTLKLPEGQKITQVTKFNQVTNADGTITTNREGQIRDFITQQEAKQITAKDFVSLGEAYGAEKKNAVEAERIKKITDAGIFLKFPTTDGKITTSDIKTASFLALGKGLVTGAKLGTAVAVDLLGDKVAPVSEMDKFYIKKNILGISPQVQTENVAIGGYLVAGGILALPVSGTTSAVAVGTGGYLAFPEIAKQLNYEYLTPEAKKEIRANYGVIKSTFGQQISQSTMGEKKLLNANVPLLGQVGLDPADLPLVGAVKQLSRGALITDRTNKIFEDRERKLYQSATISANNNPVVGQFAVAQKRAITLGQDVSVVPLSSASNIFGGKIATFGVGKVTQIGEKTFAGDVIKVASGITRVPQIATSVGKQSIKANAIPGAFENVVTYYGGETTEGRTPTVKGLALSAVSGAGSSGTVGYGLNALDATKSVSKGVVRKTTANVAGKGLYFGANVLSPEEYFGDVLSDFATSGRGKTPIVTFAVSPTNTITARKGFMSESFTAPTTTSTSSTTTKTNSLIPTTTLTNTMNTQTSTETPTKTNAFVFSKTPTKTNTFTNTQTTTFTPTQTTTSTATNTNTNTLTDTLTFTNTSTNTFQNFIFPPLPNFGGGGGSGGSNAFKPSKKKKTAYLPSLTATVFNIRGKRTKKVMAGEFSGLGVRPIISSPKKQRKFRF